MRSGGRVTGLGAVRPGMVAVLAAGLMVPAVSAAASATGPAGWPSAVAAAAGPLMAWGSNAAGQLGDGTTNESDLPITVNAPTGLRATSARASNFSVAVTPAGKVLAWGAGQAGQLGNGHNRGTKRPVQVKLPSGVKVTAVRAGNDFTVALTTAGRVLTWGYGQYGELGNGASRSRDVPVRVRLPAATKITAVSAGYGFGLALTAADQVLAWGDGASGDLGDGTTTTRRTPVLVRLPGHAKVVSAFGGGLHSLALTASGAILAWGYNVDGELGDGTTTERLRPARVLLSKGIKVTALAAGRYHSLALTADGRVLAWGSDSSGELGDGNTTSERVPVVATVPGFALAIGAGPLSNTSLAIVRKIID